MERAGKSLRASNDGSPGGLETRQSLPRPRLAPSQSPSPRKFSKERRGFWEICEERYQTRSVILTSQMPVARWHEPIGDPTVADGILSQENYDIRCGP